MKTRKQLLREISELQTQLRAATYAERISGLVSERKLPKCESIACAACRKAIIHEDLYGWYTVIGCGKDLACADYDPIVQPLSDRREAIHKAQHGGY